MAINDLNTKRVAWNKGKKLSPIHREHLLRAKKIKVFCKKCGKEMVVNEYRILNGRGLFCSRSCSVVFRRTGSKHSEETRQKIAKSNRKNVEKNTCNVCKKELKNPRAKFCITHRPSHPCSIETKIKIGLANKGKPFCEEARKKSIESLKKRIGEQHPRWIKDRSNLKKYNDSVRDRRSYAYAEWRKQVWLRDNFTCKIANPDCRGKIEAHHILNWAENAELRYTINNGITLCHAHHPRKRAEEKRLIPTFLELVSVSKAPF
jgi:hypothetical protein